MKALSLSSVAELESLVTTAIYSSLITARLSPATTPPTVNIMAVAPLRDVRFQSLPEMVTLLTQWEGRCREVVSSLETEITRVKVNAAKNKAEEQTYQRLLDEAVKRRQAAAMTQAKNGRTGKSAVLGRRDLRMPVGSNKREADDIDEDGGYWDSGQPGESGSHMDIDEGAGSSRGGSSRHSKRVLGRKT